MQGWTNIDTNQKECYNGFTAVMYLPGESMERYTNYRT